MIAPAPDVAVQAINRPTTILTPRGHALVSISRLRKQLAALDPADLEAVGPYLADLLIGAARNATA